MTTTTKKFIEGPLPVLVSCRVRLTQEQRQDLKNAYYSKKNAIQAPDKSGTGGLTVTTAYSGTDTLDKMLGFSNLVFSDLVNSRDSINIAIVLKLQHVLGVELMTKEKMLEAASSFADYVFSKAEEY